MAACSGSRIKLHPALCFAIFGTGQPIFTSTTLAPSCSTIAAAAAIFSGSPPKIWIEIGRSSSVYSAYSSVRSIPRTKPSELTISVTTRPQPPCRFTRRRKAVSVIPAMGATMKGESRTTLPIFNMIVDWAQGAKAQGIRLVGFHVRRVHFHRHSLTDQIDREHEPGVRALAHQPPHHTFERTVRDFDHHPFADERARVVLQVARDQSANALNFPVRDGRRFSLERHDVDDPGALQNGQCGGGDESRETISGKQRPVDLLLAIFPAAPTRDGRQERFDALFFELLPDDLLVPRAGPDGVPAFARRPGVEARLSDLNNRLQALGVRHS